MHMYVNTYIAWQANCDVGARVTQVKARLSRAEALSADVELWAWHSNREAEIGQARGRGPGYVS
eukprot:9040890-Pyramimonas_sp.AAC.1